MSSVSAGRPSPTPSFVLKNITVDDNDSSLKYSQGWERSKSSNAFGGAFQSASGIGDIVSFSLPANATAVYYFGFKQSSGALYEACLDCPAKPTTADVDVIDAHNNGTGSSEPTLLYQQNNLDPAVLHSLAIINAPDSRFKNESTITVDSFVVTVQNGEASSSSVDSSSSKTSASSSASTSSLAGASLMAMNPTSTSIEISFSQTPDAEPPTLPTTLPDPASASAAAASASASAAAELHSQNQNALSQGSSTADKLRQPLLLTAIILVSLFVICTTLYAVMYFMRRRKRRRKAPVMSEDHWAAKFFGDKKRGSVRSEAWGDTRSEAGIRVAKGAMVEQLIPDRPSYASQPYSQNPELSQYEARPWVPPAYASTGPQAPARTVPRSAFPGPSPATASSPPFRSQSPAYGRGPVPVSGRSPSPRMSPNSRMEPNPYVAEAYARVRERAQIPGTGYGYGGQPVARGNSPPGPSGPGYEYRDQQTTGWYAQASPPAPGYGYPGRYGNPGYQGPRLHRNDSRGSNYSQ